MRTMTSLFITPDPDLEDQQVTGNGREVWKQLVEQLINDTTTVEHARNLADGHHPTRRFATSQLRIWTPTN